MTFVIQLRGRHWPESMGWQDTDFVPDDRTPAEWVAVMNEGDPQMEYRVASVVDSRMMLGLDQHEVENLIVALEDRKRYLLTDILRLERCEWTHDIPSLKRDLKAVRGVLARIDTLSKSDVG
jgi:hypothetical protein